MANYHAIIRTNYFSVNDEAKFRELMDLVKGESKLQVFQDTKPDGSLAFGFGCYGSIYGIPEPKNDNDASKEDDEDDEDYLGDDETDYDLLLGALQELLCDGDAIIIMEAGNEALRYVVGTATIITKTDIQAISMPQAAMELAKTMLGNPEFQTQLEY